MQLTLPEAVESRLSPRDAVPHLAIGMFVSEEATLGQAAEIAGLAQAEFLKELGRRRIPIHYGMEELAENRRRVNSFAADELIHASFTNILLPKFRFRLDEIPHHLNTRRILQ